MSGSKILFQLSGSIACYKACSVISKLVQNGFDVKTAATKSALRFIGTATLEGLTHKPVYADLFEGERALEHVELAQWYDLAILCPATANILGKLAAGIGDDCVSTLFLAHGFKKPYLIAPAMNRNMLAHPATKRSMSVLQGWGVKVLGTGTGRQACGDRGPGRMLEPDAVYAEILKALKA
jgi:phosphopantothenoylcysteine decarboxylase/phosphopantothenate--cysteine ligase